MEDLSELYKIFNELKNTSSRLGKEQILENNKDNNLFTYVIKFMYDPYIVTGLSKTKINKQMDNGWLFSFDEMEDNSTLVEIIDYLKKNNTGKDADIYKVNSYLGSHREYEDMLKDIFTKDLVLGIQASTINKVYGEGFIPTFSVMLAEKYFDKPEWVSGKEFIITEKLDGCVSGDTFIETNKGLKTISSIETSYSNIEVKSYNPETGRIEFRKIENFMKGLSKNSEWYEIETVTGRKLKITGNDLVMTRSGWKEVRFLTSEDEVFVDEIDGSSN